MNSQPSLHQLIQQSPAEYVCLNCALPECDEGAPGCLYLQVPDEPSESKPAEHEAKPTRDRRLGKTCPICDQPITDKAQACRWHRWEVRYA